MKAVLSILALTSVLTALTASAQAATKPICYTGKFTVGSGKIHLKYEVKDNLLHVEVLNPDEKITLNSGKTELVKDAFDPGPDMKLVPMEGVRCPCTALQTEKGNFTFIVEQLGDRSERATMDYFGIRDGQVEAQRCKQ
jgi:hypothetical protein